MLSQSGRIHYSKPAFVVVALLAASSAFTQNPPTTPPAAALPPGWEEVDPRFVFLTVRLASVETSIDAVNKQLKDAGYKQAIRQDDVVHALKGNEIMDRKAGGPAPWQEFYGKTAEKFFYHPTDKNSTYHTETSLTQQKPGDDIAGGSGVAARQGLPVPQRPPQFDYIYRANNDTKQRAEAEIEKLSGKIDALTARKRELEAEQAALWGMISFRAISSREFASKALYRFELDVPGPTELSKQRQEATRAAAAFVRSVDHAMAVAEASDDRDSAGSFTDLYKTVSVAWKDVQERVESQSLLMLDSDDVRTPHGRFLASAKRLPAVTKNISDAQALATEGDKAGDEQRKQTFRASLQQSLFDCATNLYTVNDCVVAMAKDWGVTPDVQRKIVLPVISERLPRQAANSELKVVDLMSLIQPDRDSLMGRWAMTGGHLVAEPNKEDKGMKLLEIQYAPVGEYDFKIIFARKTGHGNIALYCAMAGKQFPFVIGAKRCGFDVGSTYQNNPSNRPLPEPLEDNRKYEVLVKVRNSSVSGYLDGTLLSTWNTDYSDMGIPTKERFFVLKKTDTLGLASSGSDSSFDIYSTEVIPYRGK